VTSRHSSFIRFAKHFLNLKLAGTLTGSTVSIFALLVLCSSLPIHAAKAVALPADGTTGELPPPPVGMVLPTVPASNVTVADPVLAPTVLPTSTSAGSMADPLKGSLQSVARPYRVGPGDVLSIHVYNQADFTQPEVAIGPDGYATFNTIGAHFVAGKTIPEIQDMVREEISELIKNPRISIGLARTKPGVLYITGAVTRPGLVQMATDPKSLTPGGGGSNNGFRAELRLANALAAAGGLMGTADLSQVQIKRAETGAIETYDLWKFVKDGDASQDVLLFQGDSIHVPEMVNAAAMSDDDFKALVRSSVGPGTFPVRIIGYVTRPGVYDIGGLTPYLNTAIARGDGYAVGANRKVVAIRRFTNSHQFTTLFVNPEKMDVALRPNDIIWVSERRVYSTGRFFATVSNVFAPFTNIATSTALVITGVRN
jgi:polysaccharide biosynthesis/export protein